MIVVLIEITRVYSKHEQVFRQEHEVVDFPPQKKDKMSIGSCSRIYHYLCVFSFICFMCLLLLFLTRNQAEWNKHDDDDDDNYDDNRLLLSSVAD